MGARETTNFYKIESAQMQLLLMVKMNCVLPLRYVMRLKWTLLKAIVVKDEINSILPITALFASEQI